MSDNSIVRLRKRLSSGRTLSRDKAAHIALIEEFIRRHNAKVDRYEKEQANVVLPPTEPGGPVDDQ